MDKKLKSAFDEVQNELEKTVKEFPWDNKKAYAYWLANSYHYALNSTRILALASGTMPLKHTKLSNRFISHAAEEKGHERLLENDVKTLGFEMKDLPVTSEMQTYYRSLYYWTTPAGETVGLIGWVLSLEGLAALTGPWMYQQVTQYHGEKSASFLKVHSDADPDHLEKAFEITKLLSPDEVRLVQESLIMYSKQYVQMLKSISADCVGQKNKNKKAA